MTETPKGRKRLTPEKVANRIAWVRALVSGDYRQQTNGVLRNYDGYCCLGVAGHALDLGADFVREDSGLCYLPTKWAMAKLGLTGGTKNSDGSEDQERAGHWNDFSRHDFLAIADRVALATEKAQHFDNVADSPELVNRTPGEYAREWLTRMENK